jgi:hypothetical protein
VDAAAVEFDAAVQSRLRDCLSQTLLKLSGVTDVWRAKKGASERDGTCRKLQALHMLGLCDVGGEVAQRISEAANCGSFIEAAQIECVKAFERCSEALLQRLIQLFCSFWAVENCAENASQVAVSISENDCAIRVTCADTDVVACVSIDQLRKLQSMHVYSAAHPHSTRDPPSVFCRFIEDVFACVTRYNSVFYPDGGRLQASQPHALFQFCSRWFGATIEAFASPFNRNTSYPIYYSAFPDVDCPFGSCGSFFDARLPPGVALCCPPSDSTFLDCTARFITAMSQRDDCSRTSFVVVVPDWPRHTAASSQCHALLQASAFKFSSGGRTFSCLRRQGGVCKVAVLPVDQGAVEQRAFQSKFGVQM